MSMLLALLLLLPLSQEPSWFSYGADVTGCVPLFAGENFVSIPAMVDGTPEEIFSYFWDDIVSIESQHGQWNRDVEFVQTKPPLERMTWREAYIVTSKADHLWCATGKLYNREPIQLQPGDNWLGFPYDQFWAADYALSGIRYTALRDMSGDVCYLGPGLGRIVTVTEAQTLVFPVRWYFLPLVIK